MKPFINLFLLLAVVNIIHCDEYKEMIRYLFEEILESVQIINGQLKGHKELLQRIPDMQEKLQNLENNVQGHDVLLRRIPDMQEKLQHLQNNLQGLNQETGQLVRREVLEHLTNVSAAANEEIKSYVHEEISGVTSSAQQGHDEILQRIPNMQEKLEHLENYLQGHDVLLRRIPDMQEKLQHLQNNLQELHHEQEHVKDVDECAEGKDDCVPNATCKNSIGSYSCSCNKHFEGDGRTSCEFQCTSPAKTITGLGCVAATQRSQFTEVKDICEEEGGRLVQHVSHEQLRDMVHSFGFYEIWVGVYDGKWTSDESLVPEDLWVEGYRPDPSKLCGIVDLDSSSSSYKLNQWSCSQMLMGYCQFQMP